MTTFLKTFLLLFWLKIVLGVIVIAFIVFAFTRRSETNGKNTASVAPTVVARAVPNPAPSPSASPEAESLPTPPGSAASTATPAGPAAVQLTSAQAAGDIETNRRYFEYLYDTEVQMAVLAKARLGRMKIEKEAADLLAGKCCDMDPAKRMAERIEQLEHRAEQQPKVIVAPPPPTPRPAPASPCAPYVGQQKKRCQTTLRYEQLWGGN